MDILPVKGERYVWEIPEVNFGPVFMEVHRVIRGVKPRVIFWCQGADEHRYRRTQRLPLPVHMQRKDWT